MNYLDVKYGERHIQGSPFPIKVSDPSQIRVDLQDRIRTIVGDPVTFNGRYTLTIYLINIVIPPLCQEPVFIFLLHF